MDKISPWRSVGRAYRFPFTNFGTVIRAGWLWILAFVFIDMGASAYGYIVPGAGLSNPIMAAGQILCVVAFMSALSGAILAAKTDRKISALDLAGVKWKLALYLLPPVLLAYMLRWPVFFVLEDIFSGRFPGKYELLDILRYLVLISPLILFARAGLILPATAIGNVSLGEAWRMGGGNGWRMAIGAGACCLPLALFAFRAPVPQLVSQFAQSVPSGYGTGGLEMVFFALAAYTTFVVFLQATILSAFFADWHRRLSGGGGADGW